MAAGAIESDVELAYRLQLEEAMAASLAFQPSSSNSALQHHTEIYRVYFAGLLSEERVSSSYETVTYAAIAVAICDSMDQLIFETRKPLDIIKSYPLCMQIVELHALIEALNAATALNLYKVELFCDYRPLYEYVSGQRQPKEQNIIYFLDKVNLLRKSFAYCEPCLIATKDVKFVFNLVREEINSQISKLELSVAKVENCVICLDDKCPDQFFSMESCTHRFCSSCMRQHVEVTLLNGVLPICPQEGCRNKLRIESCGKLLTPKFTEMMRQRLKEDSIPVTEKVYCPFPKCSTLMSRTEVDTLPNLAYRFGAARTCYKCHGDFCINCRVPFHENMNCAQYQRSNPTQLVEELKLKSLAERNLWRQCIKCKHMIELDTGCYHMTCRCGYEFCYTCGAEWVNKKATCDCPLWDEERIMNIEEEDGGDVHENGDAVLREGDAVFEAGYGNFENGHADAVFEAGYDNFENGHGDDVIEAGYGNFEDGHGDAGFEAGYGNFENDHGDVVFEAGYGNYENDHGDVVVPQGEYNINDGNEDDVPQEEYNINDDNGDDVLEGEYDFDYGHADDVVLEGVYNIEDDHGDVALEGEYDFEDGHGDGVLNGYEDDVLNEEYYFENVNNDTLEDEYGYQDVNNVDERGYNDFW